MDLIKPDVVAEIEHLLGFVALLFGTVGVVARFAWKRSVELRDWRRKVDATMQSHGGRLTTLEESDRAQDRAGRRRWWHGSRRPG